jgi:hypothetical protein
MKQENQTIYSVIVGNIGTIYLGHSYFCAEETFDDYVEQSKEGFGRARDEPVIMLADEEIEKEYQP